jgi:hypothetical protein
MEIFRFRKYTVFVVVVPIADGGEVMSSSLWHPSRV